MYQAGIVKRFMMHNCKEYQGFPHIRYSSKPVITCADGFHFIVRGSMGYHPTSICATPEEHGWYMIEVTDPKQTIDGIPKNMIRGIIVLVSELEIDGLVELHGGMI